MLRIVSFATRVYEHNSLERLGHALWKWSLFVKMKNKCLQKRHLLCKNTLAIKSWPKKTICLESRPVCERLLVRWPCSQKKNLMHGIMYTRYTCIVSHSYLYVYFCLQQKTVLENVSCKKILLCNSRPFAGHPQCIYAAQLLITSIMIHRIYLLYPLRRWELVDMSIGVVWSCHQIHLNYLSDPTSRDQQVQSPCPGWVDIHRKRQAV